LNATSKSGKRPIDFATKVEMRQAIVNEEKRRRDRSVKRSVIPNPYGDYSVGIKKKTN
jgi:hypothetical protein